MSLVTTGDIRWTAYGPREGPIFVGRQRYDLLPGSTVRDKFLKVVTSAEGGHYDAVNMYDRMVVSLGLIQWAEAGTFNASKMLGAVCAKLGASAVTSPLTPALSLCNATFKQNHTGQWRFFVGNDEVLTADQQRSLFLGCTGLKGSWGEKGSPQRARALLWAACFANIWNDPAACKVQAQLASTDLINYAFGDSRKIMFGDVTEVLSNKWAGATRAMFLMYAVNLPTVANNSLAKAVQSTTAKKWSQDWCLDVMHELVFAPNIPIYPHRYSAVKNVVEQLFEVNLPTVDELKDRHDLPPPSTRACADSPISCVVQALINPIIDLFKDKE